jgi:predicted nucleic acid-binding protein
VPTVTAKTVQSLRWVLDASAAINIVMRTAQAAELISTLQQAQLVLAPALYHSEIANTLWKYVRASELAQDTAITRYEEAIALVDVFEADESLAVEALVAAVRHKHPVYDMIYLTLARRRGCKLLTVDKKLKVLAASF